MTSPSFHPNLPTPAFHMGVARLRCSREQYRTFARIADAGKNTVKFTVHMTTAIELCCDIGDMYERGNVVLITAPRMETNINLHSLRMDQIRPYSHAPVDISSENIERLFKLGELLNLNNLDDILCSVWDNYLYIMSRLLPPKGGRRTLVEVYASPLFRMMEMREIIVSTMPKR